MAEPPSAPAQPRTEDRWLDRLTPRGAPQPNAFSAGVDAGLSAIQPSAISRYVSGQASPTAGDASAIRSPADLRAFLDRIETANQALETADASNIARLQAELIQLIDQGAEQGLLQALAPERLARLRAAASAQASAEEAAQERAGQRIGPIDITSLTNADWLGAARATPGAISDLLAAVGQWADQNIPVDSPGLERRYAPAQPAHSPDDIAFIRDGGSIAPEIVVEGNPNWLNRARGLAQQTQEGASGIASAVDTFAREAREEHGTFTLPAVLLELAQGAQDLWRAPAQRGEAAMRLRDTLRSQAEELNDPALAAQADRAALEGVLPILDYLGILTAPEFVAPASTARVAAGLRNIGREAAERVGTFGIARDLSFLTPEELASLRAIQVEPAGAPAPRWQAALRDPETGEIYTGANHAEALDRAPEARWDALSSNEAASGFVDASGRFMSREEALAQMSTAALRQRSLMSGVDPTQPMPQRTTEPDAGQSGAGQVTARTDADLFRGTFEPVLTPQGRRAAGADLRPTVSDLKYGAGVRRTYVVPSRSGDIVAKVDHLNEGGPSQFTWEFADHQGSRSIADGISAALVAIQRDMDLYGEGAYSLRGATAAHNRVYERMAQSRAFDPGGQYEIRMNSGADLSGRARTLAGEIGNRVLGRPFDETAWTRILQNDGPAAGGRVPFLELRRRVVPRGNAKPSSSEQIPAIPFSGSQRLTNPPDGGASPGAAVSIDPEALSLARSWIDSFGGGPEAEARAIAVMQDQLRTAGHPLLRQRLEDAIASVGTRDYARGQRNMFSARVEDAFPEIYAARTGSETPAAITPEAAATAASETTASNQQPILNWLRRIFGTSGESPNGGGTMLNAGVNPVRARQPESPAVNVNRADQTGPIAGTDQDFSALSPRERLVTALERALEEGRTLSHAELAEIARLSTKSVRAMLSDIRAGGAHQGRPLPAGLQQRLQAVEDQAGDLRAEVAASAPEIKQIRALASAHTSLSDAADQMGKPYDWLRQTARRHAIEFPDQRSGSDFAERNARWLAAHEEGVSFAAIARAEGGNLTRGAIQSGIKLARAARERGETPVAPSPTSEAAQRIGISPEKIRAISAISRTTAPQSALVEAIAVGKRTDLPTTAYHATTENVQGPLREGLGSLGRGVYHSLNPRIGERLVADELGRFPEGANIVPERLPALDRYVPLEKVEQDLFQLAQRRGVDIDDPATWTNEAQALQDQLVRHYQRQGYVGIYDPDYGGVGQLVTWEASNRRAPWARMDESMRHSSDPLSVGVDPTRSRRATTFGKAVNDENPQLQGGEPGTDANVPSGTGNAPATLNIPDDPANWRELMGQHPWIDTPAKAQIIIMNQARTADGARRYSAADIANATGYTEGSVPVRLNEARRVGVPIPVTAQGRRAGVAPGGNTLNRAIEIMEQAARSGERLTQETIAARLGVTRNGLKARLSNLRTGHLTNKHGLDEPGMQELRARLRALEARAGAGGDLQALLPWLATGGYFTALSTVERQAEQDPSIMAAARFNERNPQQVAQ